MPGSYVTRALNIVFNIVMVVLALVGYGLGLRPLIKDSYFLGATDFGLLVFIFTASPLLTLYLREKERKKKKYKK
jgi:hypothetical protein